MKLYLILPLVAAAGFAVEPVALGHGASGRGSGGGHGGGHHGGFGRSSATPATIGSRAATGSSAARSAYMGGRSVGVRTAGAGGHHRHHGHGHRHHHRHHGHHGIASRRPLTYPQNFPNYGYSANYNTAYYRGGFRQNTAPYGFPATFQPAYVGNPYSSYGYAPRNQIMSYGTTSRFRPYTGYGGVQQLYPAYVGSTYSPYYQGQIIPGYQAYGVYGPNGAYTVPAGGVGTAAIQSRLLNAGYYAGPVDGFAGPLTRAAISRYQYQYGLPVTGRIDGFLVRQMRESAFY